MKKTYMAPTATVVVTTLAGMLCQSGVNGSNGLGYGGVDADGSLDPASRHRNPLWNDEEEDF